MAHFVSSFFQARLAAQLSIPTAAVLYHLSEAHQLDRLKACCETFISYRFDKVAKTAEYRKHLSLAQQQRLQALKKDGTWEE